MPSARTMALPLVLAASFFGSAAIAETTTCYSGVNIFTARGTGEVPANGLGIEGVHINAVLAAIPNSNAVVVDYPAAISNSSVAIGVQNGTRQIESYLDACPTSKVVIMGYSQGAVVMGDVITGAAFTIGPDGTAQNYTVPPLAAKYDAQVVAVVFWGDPQFNIDIGVNSDQPYPCNVSSQNPRRGALWESYGDRLEEWCNYSDFACCATGNTFAGHISYFSNENGTITADFVSAKYNAAIASGGGSKPTSSTIPKPTSRSSTLKTSVQTKPTKGTTISAAASSSARSSAPSQAVSSPPKVSSVPAGTTTSPATKTTTKGPSFPTLHFPTIVFPTFPPLSFPPFPFPTLAFPTKSYH